MTDKTSFADVAAQAKTLAAANTTTDWGAVAVNLVALPFLFSPILDTDDTSQQREVAMPDDWLTAVAALPTISREGLEHLAKALEKKGWVSVSDARRFVEIETEAQASAAQRTHATQKAGGQVTGAALLLARAEKELPGTLQRFTESATSFAQAAGGVLSFTLEKTIWVGKGLGVVASFMRDVRKG